MLHPVLDSSNLAISMVNQSFNDKKEGLIPKDHKDVVSVHFLSEFRLKPFAGDLYTGFAIYSLHILLTLFAVCLGGCAYIDGDGDICGPKQDTPQGGSRRKHHTWLPCLWSKYQNPFINNLLPHSALS